MPHVLGALTTKVAFQVSVLYKLLPVSGEEKTFLFPSHPFHPSKDLEKFCVHPNRERNKYCTDFPGLEKPLSPCLTGKAAVIKRICYCQQYVSAGGTCCSLFIKEAEGNGSVEHALQLPAETSETGSEFPALKHFAAPAEQFM